MKVLFIDDDEFLRKVYETALREHGFEVAVGADGDDGLKQLEIFKPDVVVTDAIMPKKNGYEVLQQIKANPQTQALPVIMFSNLAQTEDRERALKLGAAAYLVKDDTTYDSLIDTIKKLQPSG